jgi:hypothetical protein
MILRLCVAALALLPQAAFAQGNPGPFGGLFGRIPERVGAYVTIFDLRGSGGAQWDDALMRRADGSDAGRAGTVGNASGIATFLRRTDRTLVEAHSTAEYRQTLEARAIGGTSFSSNLLFAGRPTTRLSFDATAGHIYSPFFRFHPSYVTLESGRVVPGLPFVASLVSNQTVSGMVGMSYQYGKHSNLTVTATRRDSTFRDFPAMNVSMDGFQALTGRNLNRSFRLKVGYGRERWTQPSTNETHIQEEIEAGFDLSRGLSLGRRTTFSFSTASTLISRRGSSRRYRLNGSASVMRQFGRTWQIGLNANRGTEVMPGFIDPVFSDTVSFNLGGLLSRRTEWVMELAGGSGRFGVDHSGGGFDTASAVTMLTIGLSRRLGFFTQMGYYQYSFPEGASPIVAASRLSRRTAMMGLTAWLPVYTRERGTSDSR